MDTHQARDKFLATMLRIISAGSRLQAIHEPADDDSAWTPVMRERFEEERARWVKQLDEATEWMVDHLETFMPTWPSDHLRGLISTYVATARWVMISERQDDKKAELLCELTSPVWEVFGSRAWQRGPRLLPQSIQRLDTVVEAIHAEVDRRIDAPMP
ncbi:hypothetical protein [Streptomyces sp. NPDC056524]|uniref:hypothetical protein n=1 Tax=Streptomyces sp. NPDC056524 TaxID=3345851 RepID=UPI0036B80F52